MKMITNITQNNFKGLARIRQSFIWVDGTLTWYQLPSTTVHGAGFLVHFLRKKKIKKSL